jgi:hypothetical protein
MGENLCQLFISQRLITRIYRDSENWTSKTQWPKEE